MLLFWLTLGGMVVGSVLFWLGIKKISLRLVLAGNATIIAPVVAHIFGLI